MKTGWDIKKLEELFDVQSSKRVHKKDWQNSGIPFYRAREVVKLAKHGFVNNELFISQELYNEYTKEKGAPKEDDIIISAVGTLGECYLVKSNDKFYIKDASVLWFVKKTNVFSRFIEYSFKSPEVQAQVMDKSMGATVGTLTISRAKNIKIPTPPLPEQKRIVSILDKAFAAIDKAKANAEKNLNNAKELFESYLWSYMSDKKWERVKLQDICTKVEYGSSSKSLAIGKVPVLRMGNIQKGKFDWSDLVYTDNKEEIEKYTLEYNDILFNRTNSPELVGKTAIYKGEQPAIFAGYLIRIHRKKELINADFLNFYLNSLVAFNYGKTVMSASINQANINGTKLKTYPIPLPPIETQEQIVNNLNLILSQTISLSNTSQKKLDDLEELKKSILHKAFNGEF